MLQSLQQHPPSPMTKGAASSSSSSEPPSPISSTNPASTSSNKRSGSGSPSPRPLKQQKEQQAATGSSSRPLRLLTLLLQCAESVSVDNLPAALALLPEISSLSSPFGSSPERVAAYFSDALRSRILSSYLSSYSPLPLKPLPLRIPRSFHLLNSLTPLLQFSHFTSNQAIFQSLLRCRCPRLHIIDLDIMQGLQWPALFHLLASAASSSRPRIQSLRITGIGPDSLLLHATGLRLADFAASLNLPFRFTPLEGRVADLAAASAFPPPDPAEATVVHWTQHCLYDVTGSDLAAARFLAALRPRLFTVVEQDLGAGAGGGFLGRFVEALHYYSALFDAIGDGGGGGGDQERWEVERGVLGGEIRNIVAVGGPKRTGEVRLESWGDELRRLGFRQVSLAGSPAAQASLLLGMVPWKGYTLAEEGGRLKLGWKDLSLLTASAWRPPNATATAGEEEAEDGGGEED